MSAPLHSRKFGIAMLLLVAAGAFYYTPGTLVYKNGDMSNIPGMFGYLVLVAIFVERAIEIFLSAWRSQEADVLDRTIDRLEKQISEGIDPAAAGQLQTELDSRRDERTHYRAKSRSMAQWIGLVIGVLVALVGVRILGNIVIVKGLNSVEMGLFTMVDVLLTGAVLAGGSDAVNKAMKIYNNIMQSTAEKVRAS